MITKETKGYTKSGVNSIGLFLELKKQFESDIFKNPNERLDDWIIRKTEDQISNAKNEEAQGRPS